MKLLFRIFAVVFIGAAAYLYWQGNTDGLFIAAVLGSVCFFLSIRFDLSAKAKARESAREAAESD